MGQMTWKQVKSQVKKHAAEDLAPKHPTQGKDGHLVMHASLKAAYPAKSVKPVKKPKSKGQVEATANGSGNPA